MSDVVIRLAAPAEFAEIGRITLAAYSAGGHLPEGSNYAPRLADAATRARDAELLVAVDHTGTVLGTVTMALPGTPYAEVSHEGELEFRMLAVSPAAQGRGIGAALINAVLDRARGAGIGTVAICSHETMHAAHRLYLRLGFVHDPDRDWYPIPAVRLLGFTKKV